MSFERGNNYKIVYRKSNKGEFILFKSNLQQKREKILIKIGGRNIDQIFNQIAKVLKEKNLIEDENVSNNYITYKLNQDIGPIVGGFLILIRRSREPLEWIPYFGDLIQGEKYMGSKTVLYHLWFLGLDLSQDVNKKLNMKYELNPKVLDSISAGTKIIAKKLWKIMK
ncbi:hypothetical protein [Caldisphaera sp.]|uniref:hypothetical protein n=1 Tax=Caldisphaera sp. TaxID=2060322 RepID=UPI003D09AFEB